MKVPPHIMSDMLDILPTRRDVRMWWKKENSSLGGLTPEEQFLRDSDPLKILIQSYKSDRQDTYRMHLDGLDGVR